jgi:transcriptional regulator with XRE-family HTH domain
MSQTTDLGGVLDWDLVDRLHKSLRISGVSVSKMADDLGVHRNTVTNYLSGRVAPDKRTITAWALSTGVPRLWLQTGQVTGGDDGNDGGNEVTRKYDADEGAQVTPIHQAWPPLATNLQKAA